MSFRNHESRNEGAYLTMKIRQITQEDIHNFNYDFTTRYSKWLSQGVDMKKQYDREIEGFINGYAVFELGKEYTNSYGVKMVVESIDGETAVITLDGETYEAATWRDLENGTEVICCLDCIWWAGDKDNENETNDRGTEEEETF